MAHYVMTNDEDAKGLSTLNVKRMGCIGESKKALTNATRGFTNGVRPYFERGKIWHMVARSRQQIESKQNVSDCSARSRKYSTRLNIDIRS